MFKAKTVLNNWLAFINRADWSVSTEGILEFHSAETALHELDLRSGPGSNIAHQNAKNQIETATHTNKQTQRGDQAED